MKPFIQSAKTYFRKRQFYYRLLMPYLILTILAVIVTGILGLWIIGSRYNSKIIDADRKICRTSRPIPMRPFTTVS